MKWISRITVKSEAYALSDESNSSNAYTRLEWGTGVSRKDVVEAPEPKVSTRDSVSWMDKDGDDGVLGSGLSGVLPLRLRGGGSRVVEIVATLRDSSKDMIASVSISDAGVTGIDRDEQIVEEASVLRRVTPRRGDRGGSGGDGRGDGMMPPSELIVSGNWKL